MRQIERYKIFGVNDDGKEEEMVEVNAAFLAELGIKDPVDYLIKEIHANENNFRKIEIHPIEIDGICHHPIIVTK